MGSAVPDMKRVHREVAALLKNMNSQFDGQVIIDVTNLEEGLIIKLFICPNAGVYKDCEIEFEIDLFEYPSNVYVTPISNILHPNIDYCGGSSVCVNILEEWSDYAHDYKSLDLVVQGLIYILHQPEVDDAVHPLEAFVNLNELERAVDKAKYGGEVPTHWREFYPFDDFTFTPIYRGSDEQITDDFSKIEITENLSSENETTVDNEETTNTAGNDINTQQTIDHTGDDMNTQQATTHTGDHEEFLTASTEIALSKPIILSCSTKELTAVTQDTILPQTSVDVNVTKKE